MKQVVRVLRSCSHNFAWTAQIDNSELQESYVDYPLSRRAPKIRMGRAHCCVDHFGVRIVGIISLQLGFLLSRICMKQGPAFSKKSASLPACLQLIPSRITQIQRRSCLRRIRTMEQCPNAFQAARRTFLHLAVDFAII